MHIVAEVVENLCHYPSDYSGIETVGFEYELIVIHLDNKREFAITEKYHF